MNDSGRITALTAFLLSGAIALGVFSGASAREQEPRKKDQRERVPREQERPQPKPREKKDEVKPEDAPLKVFHGLERAWKGGDAEAVASFAGEGRIYLDVRGMGKKGGFFSRSQVYYLFRNMFKDENQLKFEFVRFHNIDKPDRRVYGIAYRSWKNVRTGKVFQDKVYVTLGREGSGWVVAEIKTTR